MYVSVQVQFRMRLLKNNHYKLVQPTKLSSLWFNKFGVFWVQNSPIASNKDILSTKFSYCLKFGVFWAQHPLIASNMVYSEHNILLLPRIWCILSTIFSYCLEFGVFWVQNSLIASPYFGFKWLSMHGWQCQIYNGTLESFVWSSMN